MKILIRQHDMTTSKVRVFARVQSLRQAAEIVFSMAQLHQYQRVCYRIVFDACTPAARLPYQETLGTVYTATLGRTLNAEISFAAEGESVRTDLRSHGSLLRLLQSVLARFRANQTRFRRITQFLAEKLPGQYVKQSRAWDDPELSAALRSEDYSAAEEHLARLGYLSFSCSAATSSPA